MYSYLCALILTITNGVAWAAQLDESAPAATRAVARALDQVYVLKTATDAKAPKATYGSCFVLKEEGVLVTNYHVVATALHEPDKYNLYFVDADPPLPAEVIAFDAINDLALVRVARAFPKAMRLAAHLPEAGARIFSIGWPEDLNKSIIEGNYNGPMTAGPYRKLQMSIPLNPGMSGGPTLNEAGEVIGVNVSIRSDSQSLAFAVPKDLIEALQRKPPGNFSRPAGQGAFDEETRAQLDAVQDQLTAILLRGPSATVEIGGWQAAKPARSVKCWREQDNAPQDLTVTTSEHCYLPGSAQVRREIETGTFRVKFESVEGAKLDGWQFVHHLNDAVAGFPFFLAEYVETFSTRFKCGEMDLVNTRRVPLRAHYCLNAYVRYPEIYNLEFEAVTLPRERSALLVGASLLGFSSRNGSEIMRALLNSIRPEPQ
jgi:hypothetical protein